MLTLNPELALIFDLDGVVVDSMPMHTLAWERYLEANGIDPRNVEGRMHGKRNDDLVRDLFGADLSDAAVFEHGAAKEKLFRQLIGTTLRAKLVPGIREFVEEASKMVPLAVGTNAEPANVDFILNGAGIRKYFRAIVDGSQVARPKPFPDVYLAWRRTDGSRAGQLHRVRRFAGGHSGGARGRHESGGPADARGSS